MSQFLSRKLHYIFLGADTLHIPLILGFDAIVWGIILSLPADTFATSNSYNVMGQLMPESGWAGLMFLMGSFQLTAALYNWRWQIQAISNLIPMIIWGAISLFIYQGNNISAIGSSYPFFVILAYGRFFRCVTEKDKL